MFEGTPNSPQRPPIIPPVVPEKLVTLLTYHLMIAPQGLPIVPPVVLEMVMTLFIHHLMIAMLHLKEKNHLHVIHHLMGLLPGQGPCNVSLSQCMLLPGNIF
jgi:hypothetical protein